MHRQSEQPEFRLFDKGDGRPDVIAEMPISPSVACRICRLAQVDSLR
jgi:hypothetical protein